MISKLLFIPRGAADIIKVLLHKNISFSERWNIAKALAEIKIASLNKKLNEPFVFCFGKWKISCLHNDHIGFLVKEIFVQEVYALTKSKEVFKILDLGSNIGLSVAYFKMRFPDAIIEGYEPDKNSFQLFRKNIQENDWENISAYEIAVSDTNGTLFASSLEEKASVNSNFTTSGEEESKVAAKDISEILKQNFDVIKMDVEGGEWRIFKKIIDHQLIPKANHWFVEFHQTEKNKKQFEEILNCFQQNGFEKEERKEVIYFYKNI